MITWDSVFGVWGAGCERLIYILTVQLGLGFRGLYPTHRIIYWLCPDFGFLTSPQ